MHHNECTIKILKLLAALLGRCFLIGFALLLFSQLLYMLAGPWAYEIHSKWFCLTYERFGFVMYCGLATFKLLLFFAFGIPWLAIHVLLCRR